MRLGGIGDAPDLLHELGVNGEATRGVDDADVAAQAARLLEPGLGDGDGVGRLAEDGDTGLLAQNAQLLDGGRALQVGANQQRVAALLLPPQRQLGRGGRLARTLQAGHEHHRGRPGGIGDLEALAAQDGDQLLVHGPDDLLARGQALGEGLSADPQADAVAESAGHRELDVGLEQGRADLAQGLVQVGLADATLAPQPGGDPIESVGQGVEHGVLRIAVAAWDAVAGPTTVHRCRACFRFRLWRTGSRPPQRKDHSPCHASASGRSPRWPPAPSDWPPAGVRLPPR